MLLGRYGPGSFQTIFKYPRISMMDWNLKFVLSLFRNNFSRCLAVALIFVDL